MTAALQSTARKSNRAVAAQTAANDQSSQAARFTPELLTEFLRLLDDGHYGCAYDDGDIAKHIGRGGRDLAAGHLASNAIRHGVPWEQVLAVLKRHALPELSNESLSAAEQVELAMLAGLLGLAEDCPFDTNDDDQLDALLDPAERSAKNSPDSGPVHALKALISTTCFMHKHQPDDLRGFATTALIGAQDIAIGLDLISTALINAFLADLATLTAEGGAHA